MQKCSSEDKSDQAAKQCKAQAEGLLKFKEYALKALNEQDYKQATHFLSQLISACPNSLQFVVQKMQALKE